MAKSNSTIEHTNVEAVELYIKESLLKGGKVEVPDFGYLEIKSLGDRRTVLFKPTDNGESFLRIMSSAGEKEKKDTNALYAIISAPLKEEKIVNLPQIGVFRPVKRENGEIHVSFILSSYLRKLLNDKEDVEKDAVKEVNKEDVEVKKEETKEVKEGISDAAENKNETQKIEIATDKIHTAESKGKPGPIITPTTPITITKSSDISQKLSQKQRINLPNKQKNAKVGDQIVPPSDTPEKSRRSKRSRSISGVLLFIAAVIALIVVIVSTIHSRNNKKAEERVAITLPSESISLPALAEQYYGHAAFWIYIYEANKDKLNSPINISKTVSASLVIPDLKTEYDVDVTDSMEIQRANILADIVLKEKLSKK